jgi:hypothetical protein
MKLRDGAIGAAIVAVTLAGMGTATASAAARKHSRRPTTKVTLFEAFKPSGKPALKIGRTVDGTCTKGSQVVDRNDAWDCSGYDPCFSSRKAKGYVLCPNSPWQTLAVKLKYRGRLRHGNRPKPSTSGMPWAIGTSTFAQCTYTAPPTYEVGKDRADYFCGGNMPWLWGKPSRSKGLWTIYAADEPASRLTQHAKILAAWF